MLIHLESLEEWANGDISTMKEIIHLFEDNTPPTLHLLQNAIEAEDWDSIVKHSHKLKSSYGIVTIGDSLERIAEIEQSGIDKKDLEGIKINLAKVREQFAVAVKEFDAFKQENA